MTLHVRAFGDELGDLRRARGLSMGQLAILAGFDPSYISRIEMGKRDVSRETALAFARALDATPSDTDRLLMAAGFLPSPDGMVALVAAQFGVSASALRRVAAELANLNGDDEPAPGDGRAIAGGEKA